MENNQKKSVFAAKTFGKYNAFGEPGLKEKLGNVEHNVKAPQVKLPTLQPFSKRDFEDTRCQW